MKYIPWKHFPVPDHVEGTLQYLYSDGLVCKRDVSMCSKETKARMSSRIAWCTDEEFKAAAMSQVPEPPLPPIHTPSVCTPNTCTPTQIWLLPYNPRDSAGWRVIGLLKDDLRHRPSADRDYLFGPLCRTEREAIEKWNELVALKEV